MQIEILNRHFSLGDEQREAIEEKVARLERFSPRPPISARLTLTQEAGEFVADMVFSLKNQDFRARDQGSEPEFAADAAVEAILSQLKRYKGKITGRRQGVEGGLGRANAVEGAGLLDTPGAALESEGFRLRDLNIEQALQAFRDSDHPFFVFRNLETSRVNVVYRRDNGELALMEEGSDG